MVSRGSLLLQNPESRHEGVQLLPILLYLSILGQELTPPFVLQENMHTCRVSVHTQTRSACILLELYSETREMSNIDTSITFPPNFKPQVPCTSLPPSIKPRVP